MVKTRIRTKLHKRIPMSWLWSLILDTPKRQQSYLTVILAHLDTSQISSFLKTSMLVLSAGTAVVTFD